MSGLTVPIGKVMRCGINVAEAAVVVVEGVPNSWRDGEELRESLIRNRARADWFGDRNPCRLSLPLMEGGSTTIKVAMRAWMAEKRLRKLAGEEWNGKMRQLEVKRGPGPSAPTGMSTGSRHRKGFTYIGHREDKRRNDKQVEDQKRRASGCY